MPLHLDPARLRAIVDGRLAPEERAALARHLAEPCDTCEELLAGAADVDGLDGLVDEALLALSSVPAVREERVLRARPARRRGPLLAFGGLSIAAAAALVVAVLPAEHERLKGEATATEPPRLELLVRPPGGDVSPLADGARVAVGTTVLFRVGLSEPGCLRLWRHDGAAEPLQERSTCFAAGQHVLAEGGEALGLALDHDGALTLAVVPDGVPAEVARESLARGETPPGGSVRRLHVGRVSER